jgi:hypothetical protein
VLEGALKRLEAFIQPFADLLRQPEQRQHAGDLRWTPIFGQRMGLISGMSWRLARPSMGLVASRPGIRGGLRFLP